MELDCDQKLLFAKVFYAEYIEKGPLWCRLDVSASVNWANSGAGSDLAVAAQSSLWLHSRIYLPSQTLVLI